ncbi:rhomboid family intramembrane serine protease [bacterium]|nr:rhomboid family intramembrane serine protease [bacterium]
MSYYRGPYGGGTVTLALPPFTPAVRRILYVLGGMFVLQLVLRFGAPDLYARAMDLLALDPQLRLRDAAGQATPPIAAWQLLTYALLHGGVVHLLLNGLGLWMFGGDVERVLGTRGFVRYFLVCVAGGGAAVVLLALLLTGATIPVIGASGGVIGLVVAFALLYPERRVFIFPIPFPLPAWVMALAYALINVYGAVQDALMPGGAGSVSYAAHLGGLAAGFLYFKGFIRPGSWFRRKRRHPQFRVVKGGPGPFDIN